MLRAGAPQIFFASPTADERLRCGLRSYEESRQSYRQLPVPGPKKAPSTYTHFGAQLVWMMSMTKTQPNFSTGSWPRVASFTVPRAGAPHTRRWAVECVVLSGCAGAVA